MLFSHNFDVVLKKKLMLFSNNFDVLMFQPSEFIICSIGCASNLFKLGQTNHSRSPNHSALRQNSDLFCLPVSRQNIHILL